MTEGEKQYLFVMNDTSSMARKHWLVSMQSGQWRKMCSMHQWDIN